MNRHSSIWIKFFAAFFFIGAAALLLTGIQMYYGAQQGLTKLSSYSLESMRNMKKVILENYMDSLQAPIKGFADGLSFYGAKEITDSFDALNNIDAALKAACVSALAQYDPEQPLPENTAGVVLKCLEKQNVLSDKSIAGKFNKETPAAQYLENAEFLHPLFSRFVNHWGFSDIMLVSPKGDIVFSYSKHIDLGMNIQNDKLIGSELKNVVSYIAGAGDGQIKFFDFVNYSPEGMKPVMFIAIPLIKKNGEYLGALIHTVKPHLLDKILSGGYKWEQDGFGATGDVYIAGSDGLLRSNQRMFVVDRAAYLDKLSKLRVPPDTINKLKTIGSSALLLEAPFIDAAVFEGFSGTKEYIGSNGRVLVSYAPLEIKDMNWAIVMTIGFDEMAQHTTDLNYSLARAAIGVIIAVLVLTLLLTYVFTRPIRRIQQSFMKISNGDMKAKVNVKGNDELKDLAESFNTMVDRLSMHEQENAKTTRMLQTERDFITAVMDSRGILVVVIDEDNRIIRINNSVMDTTGRDDLIGKNYLDILPRKYRDNAQIAVYEARTSNATPYLFTKSITHNNAEIFTDWMVSTISSDKGVSTFTAFIGIDVTERYRAQETLRENEAMLQIIMSHAQDAIIICDAFEKVTMWNDAAEKMFGYSFQDMLGRTLIPTIIPIDYKKEVEDACHDEKIAELYAFRKNGERVPIEISASKVRVRAHTNTFYILRDSSIRKKRETELYNALEKAKVAEKTKSSFLANMSHEIRTPLNGILGFLNLLKQTQLQQVQQDYLKIIDSSTESLLAIINEILDFSKIESGKMQLEEVEFNSWQEFEQIAELYSVKAREKNIDLVLHLDSKLPETLIGDPFRLRQILSNLLSNAVKFTPEKGRISISVTMLEFSEAHCKTRISVKDNGIGISKEKQSTIFTAFSQEDISVTRKYGGSGLGLAICSKLVQLMGSWLQLQSDKGKGSDFFFTVDFKINSQRMRPVPDLKDVTIAKCVCSDVTCTYLDLDAEYLDHMNCTVKQFRTPEEYLKITPKPDIILVGYNERNKKILEWLDKNEKDTARILIACENTISDDIEKTHSHVKVIRQPMTMTKISTAILAVLQREHEHKEDAPAERQISINAHALLVEDNAVNRRLAYIMLTQLGLTVDTAENGREAVDKVGENKYDIIFMDIHMPVLDGVAATKEIIEYERKSGTPHTPIIALTANVITEERDTYIANGMTGFLAKPITRSTLIDSLLEFLPEDKRVSSNADIISSVAARTGIKDAAILKNLLAEFYSLSMKQIEEMQRAAQSSNIKQILNISHSMKSAAINLGFDNISEYCTHIETNCASNDITDCLSALNNIELELQQIKSSLGWI